MFLFVNPINESGFCGCEENGTCLTALCQVESLVEGGFCVF